MIDTGEPAREAPSGEGTSFARGAPSPQRAPAAPSPKTAPAAAGKPRPGRAVLSGLVQLGLVIAVLAAAVAGMRYLTASAPKGPARAPTEQVYTVERQEVVRGEHQPRFSVFGNAVASESLELRALVSGEIVYVAPQLEAGERVEQGQVLATVDPFPYRGAVTEARANLREAEASLAEREASITAQETALKRAQEQLELARTDLERAEALRARGTGTQQNLEQRQLVLSQRTAAVEQAESSLEIERARAEQQRAVRERLAWKLEEAERNLADTELKAPFDGVVVSETAGVGRKVSISDVIVTLYREGSVEARFVVSDRQFGRLLSDEAGVLGREAEVTWTVGGKGVTYAAEIDRIGAEVLADRGGVELFARITEENPPVKLRPGAFVEVTIPDKLYAGAVRLPETALYGGNAVYVVEDGRMRRRPVEVAADDGADIIVTSGLEPGEEVVTTQIADAREGLKVAAPGENPRPAQTMSLGHGS
ncbi:efflux RND transporter periplasmic adaptor subunit [Afifella pfennigii]|uniref:efflux RND transporter periplasmic adaptor subunit n=1 Tax=Afifella pfennigii TaxID=209897 RepID=UPI00068F82D3|nr:efflux RND transporter periplasmic adaptor subunit [Afifella pfennigii]